MIRRYLLRSAKGTTAVEFAAVGGMLCLLTCGIVEAGLLCWMQNGLQITASMTARCGAIGSTYATSAFPCATAALTKTYATNTAQSWLFGNALTASNVTLNGTNGVVSSCNGVTGTFFSVTVSSSAMPVMPPFANITSLSASACYPMT